jgi:hypothetical protein
MPIVRILLILLALVSPAIAQDGPRDTAAAREAAQAFKVYIDGVAQKGERPDLTRPEVAALLGRIYDLDALNALPPPHGSDLDWLIDWIGAANASFKLFTRYGSKSQSEPDLAALQRNMSEYEDQYAAAMNFMVRAQAREAISINRFWAALKPEQRTSVREKGFVGARSSMAEWILEAVCSMMLSKPANVRLVAAALRDTSDAWASFILPKDRPRVIEGLTGYARQVSDETARTDLTAFTAVLQAVD